MAHNFSYILQPANKFVATFIDSPAMNILSAKIIHVGPTTSVTLQNGGVASFDIATNDVDMDKNFQLGIRPEDFIVTHGDDYISPSEVSKIHLFDKNDMSYKNK